MAIEAVVSIVILKLKKLLLQEEQVEVREVTSLLISGIQSFLVDLEKNKKPGVEEFNECVASFVKIIHRLEDVIETFYIEKISSRKGRRTGLINVSEFKFNACIFPSKEQDDSIGMKMQTRMSDINLEIQVCHDKMLSLPLIPRAIRTRSISRDQALPIHSLQRLPFSNIEEEDEDESEEEEKEDEDKFEEEEGESVEEEEEDERKSEDEDDEEGESEEEAEEEEEEEEEDEEEEEEDHKAEGSTIFGHSEYIKKLMSQLTAEKKSKNKQVGDECKKLQIISVAGEVGSGKSTLAKTIYNKDKIKKLFEGSAFWVSVVGEKNKVRDIMVNILRQLKSLKDEENLSNNALRQRLYECLKSKRYLILIDNVMSADVIQELRGALPDLSNGSRVLFTTCHDQVARQAHRGLRHKLKLLTPEDTYKFFSMKGDVPLNLMQDLQKQILGICKSLPLNILILRGLLSTKEESHDEWMRVVEQYKTFQLLTTRPVLQCSDILIFSYNDLPPHLKPCFLYLGLLPVKFEIPVRRLFRLWIAEEFVNSEIKVPEDLVQEYLDELVKRHMVEVSKRRPDGSIKTCRMLSAFHQVFVSKTVDIGFFYIHRSRPAASQKVGARGVVEHIDVKECSASSESNASLTNNIYSYISFNAENRATRAVQIGKFLGNVIQNKGIILLRVLDLEGVYKPSLPDELGKLFNLRYLGLRRTLLSTLPKSVGDLPYLETLDIKHTYITTLSFSLLKMKNLCHLCLNETRVISLPHVQQPSELQTLCGLFLDNNNKKKTNQAKKDYGGLQNFINLRKLGVTSDPATLEELGTWIVNLASLKSLRLRSKGKLGLVSELVLPSFSALEKLTHLHLRGNLRNQPATSSFPAALSVVTLSFSLLEEDPMQMLGHLPNLTVLRLLAKSYTGQKMVCPENGFPKLRVLKLWMLEALTNWNLQQGSMPNLRSLEIRLCKNLNKFPDSLLNSVVFEELILTNMPDDYVQNIKEKKQKHTAIIVNNWEF